MPLPAENLEYLRQNGLLDVDARPDFERFTRLACALLNTPVALVSLIDVDRQVFLSQQGLGEPWASQHSTPIEYSFCKHLLLDNRPLVLEDVRSDPDWANHPGANPLQIGAYAGIPLEVAPGLVLGAMCVADRGCHHFSERDIELLQELANSVVSEIRLRVSTRALNQSRLHYNALFEQAPLGILQVADADGRINALNPRAQELFQQLTELALNGSDRQALSELQQQLWEGQQSRGEIEMQLSRGAQQPFWARMHLSRVQDPGERASVLLVMVEDITPYREALYQLEQHSQALEALSSTDALTQLANRRGFLTTGQQLLHVFVRENRPIAVVFIDLNELKKTNDTLGHEAGDAMIAQFAEVLRHTFRQADLLARLGGDEFALLVADVSPAQEATLIQRLEDRLADFNGRSQLGFRLSASLGFAYRIEDSSDDLEELLRLADGRMYADKRRRKAQQ